MQLATKYFGEIEYDREDILSFSCGLFGFEEEREFLLLPFQGSNGGLLCLQSVQTPALAFVVMDPFSLNPDYAPVLEDSALREMGVSSSEELCYYVLCVVKEPVSASTVNLKCPVVINGDTRAARQVILETGGYDMRHPLSEFGGPREGARIC